MAVVTPRRQPPTLVCWLALSVTSGEWANLRKGVLMEGLRCWWIIRYRYRGIEEASWRFIPQDIGERGERRDIINGTSSRVLHAIIHHRGRCTITTTTTMASNNIVTIRIIRLWCVPSLWGRSLLPLSPPYMTNQLPFNGNHLHPFRYWGDSECWTTSRY